MKLSHHYMQRKNAFKNFLWTVNRKQKQSPGLNVYVDLLVAVVCSDAALDSDSLFIFFIHCEVASSRASNSSSLSSSNPGMYIEWFL